MEMLENENCKKIRRVSQKEEGREGWFKTQVTSKHQNQRIKIKLLVVP